MVDETIAVLEHLGGRAHIVGWSDGGIIGLLLALRRPDLVDRLVTIGTNYHFSGVRPVADDDPDDPFFAMIAGSYAERSPDGADHFMDVAAKTFHMFATEPTMTLADLAGIVSPVLVMVGDDDLIELSHTCDLYEAIPGAQLAVVPAASHALALERPETTARLIMEFLDSPIPPVTLMPSRRR
jgi:pimeloyl-ACP methyl ester carboxylesterase